MSSTTLLQVRGYRNDDTATVGRHELSNDVILNMYVRRTQCREQNVSSHVCNAKLAVPTSSSWKKIHGDEEEEMRMEEEAAGKRKETNLFFFCISIHLYTRCVIIFSVLIRSFLFVFLMIIFFQTTPKTSVYS